MVPRIEDIVNNELTELSELNLLHLILYLSLREYYSISYNPTLNDLSLYQQLHYSDESFE